MNDIKLKSLSNGKYDWSFSGRDIQTVQGNNKLINQVIHPILLKKDELKLETYAGKGCLVHEMIKKPNTEITTQQLEENIILECTKIEGIIDARVELTTKQDEVLIRNITLIKNNGEEVETHGI